MSSLSVTVTHPAGFDRTAIVSLVGDATGELAAAWRSGLDALLLDLRRDSVAFVIFEVGGLANDEAIRDQLLRAAPPTGQKRAALVVAAQRPLREWLEARTGPTRALVFAASLHEAKTWLRDHHPDLVAMEPPVKIPPEVVGRLRERTGARLEHCREALVVTRGDLDRAAVIIREARQHDPLVDRVAGAKTLAVRPSHVLDLRSRTGERRELCEAALRETGGDLDRAVEWLRQQIREEFPHRTLQTRGRRLGEILQELAGVTASQIEAALEDDRRIGEALVAAGACSTRDVARALAAQRKLPFVDLSRVRSSMAPDVLALVPGVVAREYRFVPLRLSGRELLVATSDALDRVILDELRISLGYEIRQAVADAITVGSQLAWHYPADEDQDAEVWHRLGEEPIVTDIDSAGSDYGASYGGMVLSADDDRATQGYIAGPPGPSSGESQSRPRRRSRRQSSGGPGSVTRSIVRGGGSGARTSEAEADLDQPAPDEVIASAPAASPAPMRMPAPAAPKPPPAPPPPSPAPTQTPAHPAPAGIAVPTTSMAEPVAMEAPVMHAKRGGGILSAAAGAVGGALGGLAAGAAAGVSATGKAVARGRKSSKKKEDAGGFSHPVPTADKQPEPEARPAPTGQQQKILAGKWKDQPPLMSGDLFDEDAGSADTNASITRAGTVPDVELVEVIRREAAVRYFSQMNPGKVFPLSVRFTQQKLQEWVKKTVRQVVAEEAIEVTADDPFVTVRPHFPGCHVTPHTVTVDLSEESSEADFRIAPFAHGNVDTGSVEIVYRGKVVQTIATPYRLTTQRLSRLTAAMSFLSPAYFMGLQATGLDFVSQAREGFPLLADITVAAGGLFNLGMAVGGVFLAAAGLFFWWKMPKASDPIRIFYNGPGG